MATEAIEHALERISINNENEDVPHPKAGHGYHKSKVY